MGNSMNDYIRLRGVRQNNLKNINLDLPRNNLIVFTGLSGSGKSSLAFDTIYAEGQRRYVESLSSYARQFLGQMEKPDLDIVEGLSPAIAIDQKTTSKNPRSTIGTTTEIYDYLRLLYARVGIPHCPECGLEIRKQPMDQIVDKILSKPEGTRLLLLSPIIRNRKGEFAKLFADLRKMGYVRVRVDGTVCDLEEEIPLEKNKVHNIEVVVDRLAVREESRSRITDSCETAAKLSKGLIAILDGEELTTFSQRYSCPEHECGIEELTPRMFSFNNPMGACPECSGLGYLMQINPDLILPDKRKSLFDGAVCAMGFGNIASNGNLLKAVQRICINNGDKISDPLEKWSENGIRDLLYGTDTFEGIIPTVERRYHATTSAVVRAETEALMTNKICPKCNGARLNPLSLAVTVNGKNIDEFCRLSVENALDFANSIELGERDKTIAAPILQDVRARLGFLKSVGLGYLTLARSSATLSGGESQRIRLATQIGSCLTGVLYILDEPSIGLHQRDNDKLIATLRRLRDLGNTVIVVEHDEDTMRAADWLVDIGPGPGVYGGNVIYSGTYEGILKCEESITGQYLSGKKKIEIPEKTRTYSNVLTVRNCRQNNLKGIDVTIPLGVFVCITGVSGSGKSSLINDIFYKTLAAKLNRAHTIPGLCDGIDGIEQVDKIVAIDQSPIGRTPRSNPATYTGIFNEIRELFAQTPDAKARGYSAGRFSFNVDGGRCEACGGDGVTRIEMHFLPDIFVPCDVCGGKRYNRETLEIKLKGKSIYDVLEMTVEEGLTFFENFPSLRRKLQTLFDVGLGYLKIGQASTTLSGGEAQRVKLATELSRIGTGKTVYVLDEPTTGLHSADVQRLIDVLQRLADAGNTVVVIEHNLDVIKVCDHIIDLGPEGGEQGGRIVATGTPREVADCPASYTGQYLKKMLER